MARRRRAKYLDGLPALGFHYVNFHTSPEGKFIETWESPRFEVWVVDGASFFLYNSDKAIDSIMPPNDLVKV